MTNFALRGLVHSQLDGRMGYEWIHSDDETLFLRMMIKINRYLLSNLDKYKGEERVRVERILMGGFLEESTKPFSLEGAKKRISEWEAQLRKISRQRRQQ